MVTSLTSDQCPRADKPLEGKEEEASPN